MYNLYNFSNTEILAFFLVLVRMATFFALFPLFDGQSVPMPVRILLALSLSFIVFPLTGYGKLNFETISENIIWLTMKEVFVGLVIGYIAKLFFFILSVCGEIVSVSVGLSSSQIFNPAFGRTTLVIEQFQLYLGGLLFLGLNGHHLFIKGMVASFELFPITKNSLNFLTFRDLALVGQDVLEMGIQLSAPVLGTIFIMNVAMGIISRAVPQINVLVMSWPLNILVGFGVMIISLPMFVYGLENSLNIVTEMIFTVLKTI